MNSQHLRVRAGSSRALIVVLLLAGVFAMHGLTGNHDAVMAITTHQMPATTGAADHTSPVAAPPAPGHLKPVASSTTHMSGTDIGPAAQATHNPLPPRVALTIELGHGGHLHAMGDVCLAMLAALLLALIVALARRSDTVAHPVQPAETAVLMAADWPSPPWRRPTLSKLCVLRT